MLGTRSGPARSWVIMLFALLPSLFSAAVARGHGTEIFIGSEPAVGAVVTRSPAHVVVRTRTELDTRRSRLQVFDAGKRQVDTGKGGVDLHDPDHASLVVSLPALPDGKYTVRWRAAVLEDGDVVEGTFGFTVSRTVSRKR